VNERHRASIGLERADPWPILVAATGVGLLLLRPIPVLSADAGPVLMSYAALAIAALTTPLGARADLREEALHPALVLLLGVAVVAASPLFSGPSVSAPFGPWSIPFVVAAAVAEEALFRRLLYGRLLAYGTAVAITVSAVAFALVHLPAYGTSALPLDLGAGALLSWQRWASGTWTVPAATHAAANVLVVLR
jgi:membrane protease YdiL (CAAX protease family)